MADSWLMKLGRILASGGYSLLEKKPAARIERILWNDREGNDIDEIVLYDVTVHVEQMDDRCWWIGIYKPGSEVTAPYWMGNFVADSRGRMRFMEQENAGIEWDQDKEHQR